MRYILKNQETERLKFRLLKQSDFNTWLKFYTDLSAAGFVGAGDIKTPYEQCEYWFKRVFHRYNEDLGGMNVLIHKETGEFIGQCGLLVQAVDNVPELEIGYSILSKHRNMGYATEAAQKCRDYAFEKNYADSLISIIHIDNIKSEKVAIKNGMQKTKQTKFLSMPVNVFRIFKHEWMKIL